MTSRDTKRGGRVRATCSLTTRCSSQMSPARCGAMRSAAIPFSRNGSGTARHRGEPVDRSRWPRPTTSDRWCSESRHSSSSTESLMRSTPRRARARSRPRSSGFDKLQCSRATLRPSLKVGHFRREPRVATRSQVELLPALIFSLRVPTMRSTGTIGTTSRRSHDEIGNAIDPRSRGPA